MKLFINFLFVKTHFLFSHLNIKKRTKVININFNIFCRQCRSGIILNNFIYLICNAVNAKYSLELKINKLMNVDN